MENKKNKSGKKVSIFIASMLILVIGVGAALLTYFGQTTENIEVTQPITVTGDGTYTIVDAVAGSEVLGNKLTVSNGADWDLDVELSSDGDEGIATSYVGKLAMTKKDTSTWQPIGTPIEITYTVVGDSFEFSGIPEGYTLIYYKDIVVGLEGRLENPQPAITVTGSIGSFPHVDDANIDELADYCAEPDNYNHCKGAKLWVVPTSDLTDSNLNWANMANYYYETDLVRYFENSNGVITIPAGSYIDFYTLFDLSGLLETGTYTIITTVGLNE